MLAGHLAVGLALKARYREVPLPALLLSALLLDVIWLVLVWQGVEILRTSATAQGALRLDYSDAVYSHSLFWSLFYAVVVFLTFVRAEGQRYWALPLSLAVFAHWLLDVLIYSNLPFANFGPDLRFGLNSFSLPPLLSRGIEGLFVFAGWWLYYRSHKSLTRMQWPLWSGLAILVLLLFSHQFLLNALK